jgi:hypothetical protein
VSYQTHTVAEWLAMTSLATGISAACSIPFHLCVDADLTDFDPRPLLESRAADRLLVEVTRARYTALQVRDRARIAVIDVLLAALLRFSAPVSAPKGATR